MAKRIGTYLLEGSVCFAALALMGVTGVEDPLLPVDVTVVQWLWFWPCLSVLMLVLTVVSFWTRSWQEKIEVDVVLTGVVLLTGLWQAMLGLLQVYGWEASRHSLYAVTGSFFNPGPYSGFLAIILPLAVDVLLQEYMTETKKVEKGLRGLAWVTLFVVICILPAGRSRAAWIAALLSVLWVCRLRLPGWLKYRGLWKKSYKRLSNWIFIGTLAVAGIGLFGSFFLNTDSANGRLLIWKVCVDEMKPWGSLHAEGETFGGAYGKWQEDYFASGKGTLAEEKVAGSPEYAFNEFIEIGAEYGWVPMMFVVLLAIWVLVIAVRYARNYGASGMWMALLVFSCFSYPLHFPAFWALEILVIMKILSTISACRTHKSNKMFFTFVCMTMGCLFLYASNVKEWKERVNGYRDWNSCQLLYRCGMYKEAAVDYGKCALATNRVAKEEPRFLFEWGRALYKAGNYAEARDVLGRLEKCTADPMVLNLQGRCFADEAEGMKFDKDKEQAFEAAEQCYKRSSNRLPGRVYPYYLLSKLYVAWGKTEKMKLTARRVLEMKPKVVSPATEEMKREISVLLNECME